MNERRIIRTEKHRTILGAHPYHRYILDERPRGRAIVEPVYDPRCPHCRQEQAPAKGGG